MVEDDDDFSTLDLVYRVETKWITPLYHRLKWRERERPEVGSILARSCAKKGS